MRVRGAPPPAIAPRAMSETLCENVLCWSEQNEDEKPSLWEPGLFQMG